jgi:glycosyltransferase involved in cell wall biosynthesis
MTVSWSVVITTYNRSAMLKRAVECCLAQTVRCQVVVVDDCSTDDTAAVAARFPQIVYIRNGVNLGHPRSANLGSARASGSWIKYLDDDDYLHPDCLRRMSEVIAAAQARGHDPKIITCVSTNVDINETPLGMTKTLATLRPVLMKRDDALGMMMLDQLPLGTPVQVGHERQAGIQAGGWNEDSPIKFLNGDEAEFWIRLASQGDVIFLPDALAYRTIWSGNEKPSHTDHLAISLYLKARISQEMASDRSLQGDIPSDIAHYLALHWGLAALRDGKIPVGLKLALRGMFYPSSYRHLWRRARFADALRRLHLLD